MKNDDNECFKWCVTRALNPTDNNPQRITNKLIDQPKKFDWRGIEFSVAADASVITKFERNNTNVNINVFGYGNKIIFQIYVSNQRDITNANVVELLLISDGERKHYFLIKNFNRLMALRTEKSHNSMHYCRRCLIGYRRIEALNKHSEYCSQHAAQKIELPEPRTMLSFKNYNTNTFIYCLFRFRIIYQTYRHLPTRPSCVLFLCTPKTYSKLVLLLRKMLR